MMLLEETERHSIQIWHAYAQCFNGAILITDGGDLDTGLQLLQVGMRELHQAKFVQYYTAFLWMLAESLAAAKRLEEGIEAIDEALARSARNDERWCTPELLRIKGELLLQSSHPRARGQAERLFTESLEMARQQRALSWELRIAASISRLQRANGCIEDGPQLLAGVYSRFTEGFATADLRMAESLLDQFGRRGAANR